MTESEPTGNTTSMSKKSKRDAEDTSAPAVEKKRAKLKRKKQIAELEEQLAVADSKIRIRDLQIEELTAVVARNLKRVQSESDLLSSKDIDR